MPFSLNPSLSRRKLLFSGGLGIGALAASQLLGEEPATSKIDNKRGAPLPHHRPRAKNVIFLLQSGAPSQLELFDPKLELLKRQGEEIPDNIRKGQRLTTMTSEQASLPLVGSPYKFAQHGESGLWLSELLPHTAKVADHLCMIHSLSTEAINHDPAITALQTGVQMPGRPSFGSWVVYGLAAETTELPAFVAMISGGEPGDQPLASRLWDSAFLPPETSGVRFRGGKHPMLYLDDPPGVSRTVRRDYVEALKSLNELEQARTGDPKIAARIANMELAFRMQTSVPAATNLADESEATLKLYGDDVSKPGSFAANCLTARRLVERGVRFVQLYHRGWDHHEHLPRRIEKKCQQTDQPSAALVQDLAQRGLLEDTLVIWAGEFGRTSYCQGTLKDGDFGRDHHPRCFSGWMAGGGVRAGTTYGKTDDFSYNVLENEMPINDLQATVLHLLGLNHLELTRRHLGRDFRLTDVAGNVVDAIVG